MRALFILILLSITPLTYANQQTSEVIKTLNIQGINLSTDINQARVILIGNGYEESYSEVKRGVYKQGIFKKGACKIRVSKRHDGNLIGMLSYNCRGHAIDMDEGSDVIKALTTLCNTKNNGVNNRKGCAPITDIDAEIAKGHIFISEIFTHPKADSNGYKYESTIGLNRIKRSITLKATLSKDTVKVKKGAKEKANFPTAVANASDTQIKEANKAYSDCQRHSMSLTQNCGCYADAFLKERISSGFQANYDGIGSRLGTKCLKVNTEAAHTSCMRFSEVRKGDINMTPEKFCNCYANRFADLIENFQGKKLTFNQKGSFKSQARGYCSDLDRTLK